MTVLVDSHCHLHDRAFEDDRGAVLVRALDSLAWLVTIGEDLESSRAAVELSQDRVYATVGIHPYSAASVDDGAIEELRKMAASDRVVAIGEIGLDYFKYNDTPRDIQGAGFRRQLDLAVELSLPVVIHNRESTEDLAAILDEYQAALPGGVMHCFAGDVGFVERCLGWGFHVSFAGNVTFPKAEELRIAAEATPLDRLLVETDSPYLSPQAVRGKRCEPAYVGHTCDFLAGLKGVPPETLAETTARNAASVFQVRAPA